ncbi:hypothetical protein B0H16DRAFT_1846620 [Mycena metata]|uniref:Uncharacterized protein n=1 Tax=Mycena metata TaxID=1033252 RepID=A0AAD7NWT2_9AGAR|nr:hypothetical protein B0H16DRAFT_1846620 [Mycena metata]
MPGLGLGLGGLGLQILRSLSPGCGPEALSPGLGPGFLIAKDKNNMLVCTFGLNVLAYRIYRCSVSVLNSGLIASFWNRCTLNDMPRDIHIRLLIGLIQHDEEQVKPTHNQRAHLHIRAQRLPPVVPPANGVRRRQDERARIERSVNARLGDGNGLLLHRLVDRNLVRNIHLVEFVDGTDAVVVRALASIVKSPVSSSLMTAAVKAPGHSPISSSAVRGNSDFFRPLHLQFGQNNLGSSYLKPPTLSAPKRPGDALNLRLGEKN